MIKELLQMIGLPVSRPAAPQYQVTNSGFRYRILSVGLQAGYEAALALLLKGEHLYRIHYDVRKGRKPYPVLIGSAADFEYSRTRWSDWELAAGIPTRVSLD